MKLVKLHLKVRQMCYAGIVNEAKNTSGIIALR